MCEQKNLFSCDLDADPAISPTPYEMSHMQDLVSHTGLLQSFLTSQETQGLPTLVTVTSRDVQKVTDMQLKMFSYYSGCQQCFAI
jgi:hypothetical protein